MERMKNQENRKRWVGAEIVLRSGHQSPVNHRYTSAGVVDKNRAKPSLHTPSRPTRIPFSKSNSGKFIFRQHYYYYYGYDYRRYYDFKGPPTLLNCRRILLCRVRIEERGKNNSKK